MTGPAVDDVGLLTHGVHMSMVALGLTGLTVILLPQQLERFRRAEAIPRDAHEVRVRALRAQLASSGPGGAGSYPTPTAPLEPPRAPRNALERNLLPLMLVAAIASAGAHAAVAPSHLLDNVLFGAFFIGVAVAQLSWVLALLAGTSRSMLQVAIVGNLALLLVWSLTRLWGLPFGLMPEPEALGPWDVMCAGWELIVIGGCVRLLREPGQTLRPPPLYDWTPAANAWLGATVVILLLLAVSGAH